MELRKAKKEFGALSFSNIETNQDPFLISLLLILIHGPGLLVSI